MKGVAGFTLMELLVVLAIVAGVSAAAVPNMISLINSARLSVNTGKLIRDIGMARSEAIKRGKRVVVTMTGSSWHNGWRVYEDSNMNDNYDTASESEFASRSALSGVTIAVSGFTTFVSYRPSGLSQTSGWFKISRQDGKGDDVICIGSTGRIQLSSTPSASSPCATT